MSPLRNTNVLVDIEILLGEEPLPALFGPISTTKPTSRSSAFFFETRCRDLRSSPLGVGIRILAVVCLQTVSTVRKALEKDA